MLEIEKLKFDENGLIPCIVQDYETKKVLTLAYMNAESIAITLEKKLTCFYSRSRKKLWLKGETSGNYQHLISLTADCDGDALLAVVKKDGPACHMGTDSCFETPVYGEKNDFSLSELYKLLVERNEKRPQNSYTTYLFEKGEEKILKKVGEECSETIIAAKNGEMGETVGEISDLIYHVLVMMADQNIPLNAVLEELDRRSQKIGNLKQFHQTDHET